MKIEVCMTIGVLWFGVSTAQQLEKGSDNSIVFETGFEEGD
jgi:hypothetical protein